MIASSINRIAGLTRRTSKVNLVTVYIDHKYMPLTLIRKFCDRVLLSIFLLCELSSAAYQGIES